jgi:hypothetical protein
MPASIPQQVPELDVSGIGQLDMTVASLTARGPALLLFVSEECPTYASTLRNVGMLCDEWERARARSLTPTLRLLQFSSHLDNEEAW